MATKTKTKPATQAVGAVELPLEKTTEGQAVTQHAETTMDASSIAPVVDEAAIEKIAGGEVLADGAGEEGEDAEVTKAFTTTSTTVDQLHVEIVVDPLTKATTALDQIDAAVATVVTIESLEKGMYAVGRFADMLESISYLAQGAENEAEFEGDGSPVPAKLRDWLKAGAAIFKDMAKEEVDELVAAGKVKKAAPAEAITVDVSAIGGEALAKSITDLTTDRDNLAKSLAEKDEALTKLADRIEPLAKTVADLVATNTELAKRLETIEAQPAAPKTAGAFASVSKDEDAGGAASLEKAAVLSEEDISKVLGAMSEEDRALLLIKASRQLPRAVTYR
jgi:hypothetical protein